MAGPVMPKKKGEHGFDFGARTPLSGRAWCACGPSSHHLSVRFVGVLVPTCLEKTGYVQTISRYVLYLTGLNLKLRCEILEKGRQFEKWGVYHVLCGHVRHEPRGRNIFIRKDAGMLERCCFISRRCEDFLSTLHSHRQS
jgi:hypothetical protein